MDESSNPTKPPYKKTKKTQMLGALLSLRREEETEARGANISAKFIRLYEKEKDEEVSFFATEHVSERRRLDFMV